MSVELDLPNSKDETEISEINECIIKKDVRLIPLPQWQTMIKEIIPTLVNISNGLVYSERHQSYKAASILQKTAMSWNIYFGNMLNAQIEMVMEMISMKSNFLQI